MRIAALMNTIRNSQTMSMELVALFSKSAHGQPIQAQTSLVMRRGWGIEGDVHAMPGHPRQVLITSQPVLSQFNLPGGALQENIVVEGHIEALPSGQVIQLGGAALIRLTFLCEPCAKVNQLRPGLMKQIQGQRGRLGMVVQSGVVRVGDRLSILDHRLPALSDRAKERFVEFITRVPPGTVVRTSDLIVALGVTRGYYRAIPTLIKKAAADLPVHRIVNIDHQLMLKYLPHQRQMLQAEGVEMMGDRVSPTALWAPELFHGLGTF